MQPESHQPSSLTWSALLSPLFTLCLSHSSRPFFPLQALAPCLVSHLCFYFWTISIVLLKWTIKPLTSTRSSDSVLCTSRQPCPLQAIFLCFQGMVRDLKVCFCMFLPRIPKSCYVNPPNWGQLHIHRESPIQFQGLSFHI